MNRTGLYGEKAWWLGCLFISLVVLGGWIWNQETVDGVQSSSSSPTPQVLSSSTEELSPTPTPMPFEELTIPYLREITYDSQLGELRAVAETADFTSYVTSYVSEGLRINAQLTIPTKDKPVAGWPAVVFVHGYIPPTQYTTLGKYVDYVDYLAKNDLAVFKIDLRGHGNSEGEAGGAYYSSDYIVDTLNARRALQSSGYVNPEAVGLWGHSMAGNVVMRSMAVQPDIPAVVIWAGAVYTYADFQKYGISDGSYQPSQNRNRNRRQEIFSLYGEPSSGGIFWTSMAPTSFLSDIQGGVQIHHAINDGVVSIAYSRDLASLLKENSVKYELHEYPSGGHNLTGGSWVQAMQRTVEFYRNHLTR